MEHFFPPNLGENLRSNAHQSQITGGGDADEDCTQIIGGYSQIMGEIYPPRVSALLVEKRHKTTKISFYS